MTKYKIALIQMDTGDNVAENLGRVEAMTAEAAGNGAILVTLPETMNAISCDPANPPPESLDGYTMSRMRSLAATHKIWIHCGSILEPGPDDGKSYNTSVLLNPQGEAVAVYRKLHLFDVDIENGPKVFESSRNIPGDRIAAADTPLGRFGLTICYDVRFPELYRLLALDGAQVIFVPASFTKTTGEAHLHVLLRARAIENGCYIVAPAQTGKKPKYEAYGHSMVVDPWGNVVAELPMKEGVLYADIDPSLTAKTRAQLGCLSNRRSDIYSLEYTGK